MTMSTTNSAVNLEISPEPSESVIQSIREMEKVAKKEAKKLRKAEKERTKALRKDRLIQTRVDRRLQKHLQDEARRRRMSVSNLVRNVLEDAFGLTDPDVGAVIEDIEPAAAPALDHIYAWNPVVVQRDVECSRCARNIEASTRGLIGLSDDPTADRAWLCSECGQEV